MKLSVLYVEDDVNDVFFFRHAVALAKLDINVWTVNDGDLAIQWLYGNGTYGDRNQFPMPDVLVLDLKLPRLNGFGVLDILRRERRFKDLSVVVYSSSLQTRDVTKALSTGASRFIGKTSDCAELLCYLKRLASLRSCSAAVPLDDTAVTPARPTTN